MPLRITNSVTDIAILNKWAEGIEKQLKSAKAGVQRLSEEVSVTTGLFQTVTQIGNTVNAGTRFDKIKSGNNISADMEVDSGAKLSYANNGVVNANQIGTIFVNSNKPTHAGEVLISQPGNKTAVWADPLVQGINAPGIQSGTVNPVLIGAVDGTGIIHQAQTDATGSLFVEVTNEPIVTIKDVDGTAVVTDGAVQVNIQQPVSIVDTNGQPLNSTTGALNVFTTNAAAGSGNSAAGPTGSAVPANADYTGFNSSGSLVGVSSVNPLPVAQQGTIKIVGNTGSIVDSTVGAATAPVNALATSAVFQSTIPVLTTGQAVAVQCDTTGSQYVNTEGRKATYRTDFSGAAIVGKFITFFGSATKIIRITRIRTTIDASAAIANTLLLVKCSSAPTGGTSSALSLFPLDSTNAASTATNTNLYSVVPTGGLTLVGNLDQVELVSMGTTTVLQSGSSTYDMIYGLSPGTSHVVLRTTSEGIAIQSNSTSLNYRGFIEWTEE